MGLSTSIGFSSHPAKSVHLARDDTRDPARIRRFLPPLWRETYPLDLKLLNAAREKLEHIIDELHRAHTGTRPKPRTYRKRARRDYLAVTKLKRAGIRKIRKSLGKQLRDIRRVLHHVGDLVAAGSDLGMQGACDYRSLLVATEIYRQ